MYSNDAYAILERHGVTLDDKIRSQVLGGETAMWVEQVRRLCFYAILIGVGPVPLTFAPDR